MAELIKRYGRPILPGESNDGPELVEKAGYIPAQVQIENLLNAGDRLNQSRLGYEFDADEEVPDDYSDVTRSPNFDLSDASRIQNALTERFENVKKQSKSKNEDTTHSSSTSIDSTKSSAETKPDR